MYSTLLIGLAMSVGAPGNKDSPKKETTIVGDWIGEKATRGGQDLPASEGGFTLAFMADGKMTLNAGAGKPTVVGTYKVDTKKDPAEIDFVPPEGMNEPNTLAIFKIDGDTLTICVVSRPGGERPTKFESAEGAQTTLMILKRKK